jgi:hypothetical protein
LLPFQNGSKCANYRFEGAMERTLLVVSSVITDFTGAKECGKYPVVCGS